MSQITHTITKNQKLEKWKKSTFQKCHKNCLKSQKKKKKTKVTQPHEI